MIVSLQDWIGHRDAGDLGNLLDDLIWSKSCDLAQRRSENCLLVRGEQPGLFD